ncbi:putative CorA-like mg2+ transporter protein domain-containing protein [Seiridium cardinale]
MSEDCPSPGFGHRGEIASPILVPYDLQQLDEGMDWLREDPNVVESDMDIYEFVPASSKVLLITNTQKICAAGSDWISGSFDPYENAVLFGDYNESKSYHPLAYNCRSSASWPYDMAMSATYVAERRFSWGVYYGCTESFVGKVIDQLEFSESPTFHPLTLSTIFTEHERNRHVDLVDDAVSGLMNRVLDIESSIRRRTSASTSYTSDSKMSASVAETARPSAVTQWLRISHLRKGLENWKAEVSTLVEHSSKLDENGGDHLYLPADQHLRTFMVRRSDRTRARLREIIHEYDDRIRACSIVTDGITFATQLVSHDTRTNLAIANATMEISELTVGISKAAQQDSSQMKTIAILTMTFLPGTFVAIPLSGANVFRV